MREHAFLSTLPAEIGPKSSRVLVGIGDDAAVLARPRANVVVTNDASVEGVHFARELASWSDVGFRATMASASDLAAMGATPIAAVAAISLPPDANETLVEELLMGQREAAVLLRAPIVGGNLSRGPCVSIVTTWIGEAALPVLRSGARVGDGVWLAGRVGAAKAGFEALVAKLPIGGAVERCVAAWRRPVALLKQGRAMVGQATAAIDVSDGLVADARHVARASHVRLVLDAGKILAAAGEDVEAVAKRLGHDPLDFALGGGEDYAIVATSPDDLGPAGFVRIGAVSLGEPDVVVMSAGERVSTPEGFDHFAERLGANALGYSGARGRALAERRERSGFRARSRFVARSNTGKYCEHAKREIARKPRGSQWQAAGMEAPCSALRMPASSASFWPGVLTELTTALQYCAAARA